MPVKATFDGSRAARAYAQAFRRLAALPGFDHRAVLLAETGSILKTWAGRTKVRSRGQIELNEKVRILRDLDLSGKKGLGGHVTINSGLRSVPGRIWHRTRSGKFQLAGQVNGSVSAVRWSNLHFRRGDWIDLKESAEDYMIAARRRLPLARRSAGLARQSVVQIADALGIDLATVRGGGLGGAGLDKARAALASNGRSYRNGFGSVAGDPVRLHVDILCTLPYGIRIGMDRTLAGVLMGRAAFIQRAYAKGAFDSMRGVARAFPNLIAVSGPN